MAIDWTKVTPAMLKEAGAKKDLDEALAPIFQMLDPNDQYDLGGAAFVWFNELVHYKAPAGGRTEAVLDKAWPYLSPEDRTNRLTQFFDHHRKTPYA